MSNRLAGETRSYLLQHADNPVHWHPWGEEELNRARSEDNPTLFGIYLVIAGLIALIGAL